MIHIKDPTLRRLYAQVLRQKEGKKGKSKVRAAPKRHRLGARRTMVTPMSFEEVMGPAVSRSSAAPKRRRRKAKKARKSPAKRRAVRRVDSRHLGPAIVHPAPKRRKGPAVRRGSAAPKKRGRKSGRKAPSAAQLRARENFVEMVRARAAASAKGSGSAAPVKRRGKVRKARKVDHKGPKARRPAKRRQKR